MSTVTATRTYSLRQAADLTGFSQGKFRYQKALLIAHGATITAEGWRIPHTTLEELGWLGVKTPKALPAAPSPLEVAEARIRELEAEVAQLREAKRPLFGRRSK